MKRCPVCQTMLFEDMDVCYGCLHRFPEGDDPAGEGAIDAARERQALKGASLAMDLPQIELKPASDQVTRDEGSLDLVESVDASAVDPVGLDPAGLIEAESPASTGIDADWVLRFELRCPDEPARSWLISLSHPPRLLAA